MIFSRRFGVAARSNGRFHFRSTRSANGSATASTSVASTMQILSPTNCLIGFPNQRSKRRRIRRCTAQIHLARLRKTTKVTNRESPNLREKQRNAKKCRQVRHRATCLKNRGDKTQVELFCVLCSEINFLYPTASTSRVRHRASLQTNGENRVWVL